MAARPTVVAALCLLLVALAPGAAAAPQNQPGGAQANREVPPSWEILPIPRYVDYGSPKSLVAMGKVAIVRRDGGPYQSVRDKAGELIGQSTVIEEELVQLLKESGAASVTSVADNLADFGGYDTLILLGNPERNSQTAKLIAAMNLSFAKWDDPHTPEHDFNAWKDFGKEGYLLKVGQYDGKNIVILAGYDYDDAKGKFYGAGTFYALQSLRQLIVKDEGTVKIKVVEAADKPLVEFRGAMSGFTSDANQQWRDIALVAKIKGNANIYWYGNAMGSYNVQAASKFRYPWTPEQLDLYGKFGKWCREHFITMVFCLNGDHVSYEWATPKTFDGKQKDPCHYDPAYVCEPQFKEMWAKLGYEVNNDVDIIASKFAQLEKTCGGGTMFQAMNEDDLFGLFHPADKKYYNTETADKKQNAINYGRARGEMLGRIYKRIREICPDSHDLMTFDPPGSLPYQTVLETNEYNSRDFLMSLGKTMKDMGVLDSTPVLTTGGGTLAEVVSNKNIDDFRGWCAGCKILIHENNFVLGRVGANETDPNGRRWPLQRSEDYPAGYRDKELYKRVWGIQWNGVVDQEVLGWCMGQYMWNMLALDKPKVDAIAARKVSSEKSYPLVKSFYEEFDRPIAYLPDCALAPMVVISDEIAFKNKGWDYDITYTDDMRLEAQRLRDKLGGLLPQLQSKWEDSVCKTSSLKHPGWDAYNFVSIYLARGYVKGWGGTTGKDMLQGEQLRDLLVTAYDIDQRYFAGPDEIPGRGIIDRSSYSGILMHLYVKRLNPAAKTPADSPFHVDLWKEGLVGKFFEAVWAVELGGVADGDARLTGGWGKVEEAEKEKFRTVAGEAGIKIDASEKGRVLVRARIGTGAASLADRTPISLSAGGASHADAVSKARWVTWLLPVENVSQLTIKAEKPVRVHAIEVLREIK